ncbi:hypothetical protein CRYUN_Cryun02cG0072400 [Craigia yunnanensis]
MVKPWNQVLRDHFTVNRKAYPYTIFRHFSYVIGLQASACYGYEEQGSMIAAASNEIWNDGGACRQMYQITCISGTKEGTPYPCWGSGTVEVKIVDRCSTGCRGTIDLSQEAFASIVDPDSGVINISYQQYVPAYTHSNHVYG